MHSPPCSTELCKKGLELDWDGVVLFAPRPTGFQELAELGHPGYKLRLPAGGPSRQLRGQGSVYLPPQPCCGCLGSPSGSSAPSSHSAAASPGGTLEIPNLLPAQGPGERNGVSAAKSPWTSCVLAGLGIVKPPQWVKQQGVLLAIPPTLSKAVSPCT